LNMGNVSLPPIAMEMSKTSFCLPHWIIQLHFDKLSVTSFFVFEQN
jgi:hypothetical protein